VKSTDPARPSAAKFIAAFGALYLVWGSTYLAIRIAIESTPPFLMAGARFLVAGALLFAFVRLRGAPWPSPRQWRDNFVAGTLLLLGGNGLMCWAEQTIPSGITALIVGVGPLFTVLLDWLWTRSQRPTLLTVAGLVLGMFGVVWLAAPWERGPGGLDPKGVVAVLCACVAWSLGAIYSRHSREPAEPLVASSVQMLGGSAALLVTAWLHGDFAGFEPAAVTTRSWAAFLYLISMGSLVGFSTFVWLMKHSSPARVFTYAYVNPVVALFLGWLVAREAVTARMGAAAVVIVVAVMIITLKGSGPLPDPATAMPADPADA
jgi:drug/metabolite transporter (DMT)-like permease